MRKTGSERCYLVSFEDGGRGHEPRNMSEPWNRFSLEACRKNAALPTPWVLPNKTMLDF